MAFKVFVAYSHREDQVLALRLQTLASTRAGLSVFVPPASTRSRAANASDIPDPDLSHLQSANLLLALIRGVVPPRMERELQLAYSLGKPVIPISVGAFPQHPASQGSWFHLDPKDPTTTEQQIMSYLDGQKVGKDSREAVGALILLTLGLMVLGNK